jgi:hypothetical protein
MALISTRNFVAPLTNKAHLLSILFIALAFAAFRMSGGGVSLTDRAATGKNRSSSFSATDEESHQRSSDLSEGKTPPRRGGRLDDIAAELGM